MSAITVFPSRCGGAYTAPPSKSAAHRALICAFLSGGEMPRGIERSQDISATIEGMTKLLSDKGETCREITVDCGESGSTLRFLIPIAAVMGLSVRFIGRGRLFARPLTVYEDLFAAAGVRFAANADSAFVSGRLSAGEYEVDGGISSQFITGLLLALPLAAGNSVIKIKPPFSSRSYVKITLEVMRRYGVCAAFSDEYTITVGGNQKYKPCEYAIEGDYSQAAFFMALSALCGDLKINGLIKNSVQGDRVIIDFIRSMGGEIQPADDGILCKKSILSAADFGIDDCPDLGPILTVIAAFCKGKTVISDIRRLRLKESDRAAAMVKELSALSVDISSDENNIYINGRRPLTAPVTANARNDHRIAMSLAVFAAAAEYPITIEGAECVNKSYGGFFEDLSAVGVKTER